LLERSGELAALAGALAAVISSETGRIAIVAGEAGIGKTTLLRQFTERASSSVRTLWARCEPLFTPRPLGPVLELASTLGSEVAARAAGGGTPYDVAMALFAELAAAPTVVVFEDVHWADEATLDVIRLFARRVAGAAVLLVLSYREGELDRSHPLRVVLGDLPGSSQVTRLELAGLSLQAVAELAGPGQIDAGELHRRTTGNPFYVTEVLAAGGETVPRSVRDAVLARAARLRGAARDLLDVASVVPGPVETWLLDALAPTAAEVLDECIGTGMMVVAGDRVEFRHEIARQVVEESMPPGRRKAMHRAALRALASRTAGQQNPTRLAHHADAAGDAEAVLKYAPAAAAQAIAAGARREAARLYARALMFADMLEPDRHATLLEGFADAAFFTELGREATEALRKAVAIHQERGDLVRQGDALRRLGNQLGKDGALAESTAAISQAVALLEQQPPGRELALAYNSMAAVTGIFDDDGAVLWGKKAIEVAEEAGCLDAVGDTLNIVGTAELRQGNLGGLEKLDRSLEIAQLTGDEIGVARACMHPTAALAGRREWMLAERYIRQGREFCRERGLQGFYGWLTTFAAEAALAQGAGPRRSAQRPRSCPGRPKGSGSCASPRWWSRPRLGHGAASPDTRGCLTRRPCWPRQNPPRHGPDSRSPRCGRRPRGWREGSRSGSGKRLGPRRPARISRAGSRVTSRFGVTGPGWTAATPQSSLSRTGWRSPETRQARPAGGRSAAVPTTRPSRSPAPATLSSSATHWTCCTTLAPNPRRLS
jgi:tetratricopeptide (TPR) repeat protein